jgi:hypothetical protein
MASPAPPAATRIVVERVEVPVAGTTPAIWRAEPSAAFALGFGALPSTAAGVRLGAIVSPQHFWSVEAFGGVWANQAANVENGAAVRLSVPYLGLALCPLRIEKSGRGTFTVCAGPELGVRESTSVGFATSHNSTDPTLGVVVPAHIGIPIVGGVGIRLGGEVGFALVRDEFRYEDSSGSHVVAPSPIVTASCDLGVSLSLP